MNYIDPAFLVDGDGDKDGVTIGQYWWSYFVKDFYTKIDEISKSGPDNPTFADLGTSLVTVIGPQAAEEVIGSLGEILGFVLTAINLPPPSGPIGLLVD